MHVEKEKQKMVLCERGDECKHRNKFGKSCVHSKPHAPYHYGCVKSHKTFNHCKHKDLRCISISL